jgi:ABC-type glycerol-3-phosphate transport system permease component
MPGGALSYWRPVSEMLAKSTAARVRLDAMKTAAVMVPSVLPPMILGLFCYRYFGQMAVSGNVKG